jgi:hypothetical protein
MDGNVGIGELIAGLVAILGFVGIWLKNRYSRKPPTGKDLYEEKSKNIDEVLASGDITRNSELIDELLPPDGAADTSRDMQPK